MSFVIKRGLSTLIPPKVASPNAIGAAQDAARMSRITAFYEKLPRGGATAAKSTLNPIEAYGQANFGQKSTAKPLIHLIAVLLVAGYAQQYYFHLRHHKNNAH